MQSLLTTIGPLLVSAANLLVTNQFNLIWCGGTVAYFFLWLGVLVWRALPLQRSLGRVTKALATVDDPAAFAREYDGYTKKVGSEPLLRHSWREFTESLIVPRNSDGP